MEEKPKFLIVAAHPDDEILGCGGTIARLVKEGYKAHALILGEGVTARDEKRRRKERQKDIEKLREQIYEANALIGLKDIVTYDFPDNRFDTVALLDIVKVIEKTKNDIKPDIIYTHYKDDLNIDHRITYNAVLTACRPTEEETVKQIYSFEAPSSTEWVYPNIFMPNFFMDITGFMDLKIKALKKYKTEMRNFPHPRSEEAIIAQATKWGSVAGLRFAEAFEAIRIINLKREKDVLLESASRKDCENVWLWRNHPAVRKSSFDEKRLLWDKHETWFYLKVKDRDTKIYIAKQEKEKIGVIRFDIEPKFIKVSVYLNPDFFGKGLGSRIIKLGTEKALLEMKTVKPIIAEIKKANIIAQKAFAKAGYQYIRKTKDKIIYTR